MTLSESNTRIRTFLNLDFSESRTENEITLETSEKGSWFLLRTHGEEIADGTYLIQAQDTTVKIQIKTSGLHYDR